MFRNHVSDYRQFKCVIFSALSFFGRDELVPFIKWGKSHHELPFVTHQNRILTPNLLSPFPLVEITVQGQRLKFVFESFLLLGKIPARF